MCESSREGDRTHGLTRVQHAVAAVAAGRWSTDEALARVRPDDLASCLAATLDRVACPDPHAVGRPAAPGAACGVPGGGPRIHVAERLNAAELPQVVHAAAIVTVEDDPTVAPLAVALGIPAVVGVAGLARDGDGWRLGGHALADGAALAVDGCSGELFAAELPVVESPIARGARGELDPAASPAWGAFARLLGWADERSRLAVQVTASNAAEVGLGLGLGARGVGLVRGASLLPSGGRARLAAWLLTADAALLEPLRSALRAAARALLEAAGGAPVVVRTFDLPRHELIADPVERAALEVLVGAERLDERLASLREVNPMLGQRGCRLGHPALVALVVDALLAARDAVPGADVRLLVPMVADAAEVAAVREVVAGRLPVGAMVETPRAALTAGALAHEAAFLAVGSNDLTQLVLGLSRTDGGAWLAEHVAAGRLPCDPFSALDPVVAELIGDAVARVRATGLTRPVSLVGEHAGAPASIAVCHRLGLDAISCRPERVPLARLAAAQAALDDPPKI